jgi:hypothetical protein
MNATSRSGPKEFHMKVLSVNPPLGKGIVWEGMGQNQYSPQPTARFPLKSAIPKLIGVARQHVPRTTITQAYLSDQPRWSMAGGE